jgi:AcrR family transcriptional regulator
VKPVPIDAASDDTGHAAKKPVDRRARRRQESRRAILTAAAQVMATKGIEAATMAEIGEEADVALGTLYNHFSSKQQLAVAVVDTEIDGLARAIDKESECLEDPAMVFTFGCRTVMRHATRNNQWRHLLASPGVIAESICNGFGPFATRDLARAVEAGRLEVADIELAWRLTSWAIVGYASAVPAGEAGETALPDALAAVLGIAGMENAAAHRLIAQLTEIIE